MIRKAPLWLLFLFVFAGCYPMSRNSLEEEKDPHFMEGQRRLNAMDEEGAIKSFERALQTNPNNSAAHLSLGSLYEKKNDWAAAIYHYQRHLQLRENSPMGEVVTNRMVACKRELASTVAFTALTGGAQRQMERLASTNSLLQQRLNQMETELNRRPQYVTNYVTNFVSMPQFSPKDRSVTRPTVVQNDPEPDEEPASTPRPSADHRKTTPSPRITKPVAQKQTPKPSRSTSATHSVRPGETLAVIAKKYGVSKEELVAANPSAARGAKAGEKLLIPSKD